MPNLPVEEFLKLPHITNSFPKLAADQACVYLRLYMDLKPKSTEKPTFGKYGGFTIQQYPASRQQSHDQAMKNAKITGHKHSRAPHYSLVKDCSPASTHAIPLMLLKSTSAAIHTMAETTVIFLLRTWHPAAIRLSEEAINEGLQSCTITDRMLVSQLAKLVDAALQKCKYPLFQGMGCNWSCPLQETAHERRKWMRYRVCPRGGREMLVHRWVSSVTNALSAGRGIGVNVFFLGNMSAGGPGKRLPGFAIVQVLKDLPGLKYGQPLVVSVEIMADGKPHPTPWYQHPFIGAWDNSSELHSFAVKVEWCDESTNTWYTIPLRHTQLSKQHPGVDSDPAVTRPWRKATMILQFFLNRRYDNPPSYLYKTFNPDIKEVIYNHLEQQVTFQPVKETVVPVPTRVAFAENFRQLWKECNGPQARWADVHLGEMPPQAFFGVQGRGVRPTSCTACKVLRTRLGRLAVGCSSRAPFDIDPSEPDIAQIKKTSRYLCWTLWRRPCIWTPVNVPIEGNVYNGMVIMDDSLFAGPIRIAPPMHLSSYEEYQENLVNHDGLPEGIEVDDDGDD